MERNFKIRRHKTLCIIALFLLGFFVRAGSGLCAGPEQAGNQDRIEAVVINVDQYAVYAPNLIFYFDARMDKRKIASITRMANLLRNKKATIIYSGTGDSSRDKRFILVDLLPAGEKPGTGQPPEEAPAPAVEALAKPAPRPAREAPAPAVDVQVVPATRPPRAEAAPPENKPVERPAPPVRHAKETSTPEKAGRSATITRDELTAFVRNLLELNGRKDVSAVMPFYGDRVNYYDRGVVDRDYVRRDLGYYYRNWDTINTSLDGDIVMIVLDPEVRIAKFVISYSVRNAKKSLTGKTVNIWKIERINGQLKLVDVKRKSMAGEPSGQ